MASLMPLNIKMLSTLTGLKKRNENDPGCQTLNEKFSKYRYCLKKLLKTKNRGTLKTKYLKVLVISRKLGRSLVNLEAKVKNP